MRNVIVLFDGTWNDPKDKTNVVRLRDSIDSSGAHDLAQPSCYIQGVGTRWDSWLTGGLFGRGLSQNIQAGYAWVCETFKPEHDRLFVFGFSRGAYSARSLIGLIRKCGLLKSASPELTASAYALYRDKKIAPDHPKAVAFRQAHSREIRVHFIGVWDTVGALGVPLSGVPFSSGFYRWHDTSLSKIVDHAYHAIATDERRSDFKPTLWTETKPENKEVEQRWFIGAHSNVGGGSEVKPPDCLADIALRWMQDKAEAKGLRFLSKAEVKPEYCRGEIEDSYGKFVYGIYKWTSRPYSRPFGKGVNETVDPSVWLRCKDKAAKYQPGPLRRHPDRPFSDDDTAAQPS